MGPLQVGVLRWCLGLFFFQAEDGIRDLTVTGVQTCALPISNIVDDAIPVGGIQVPSGLEPIVLHVDGPSLGGYAKIATVISADLGQVGQMRPGEIANFEAVSTNEAVEALRKLEDSISEASLVRS